ncbi:flagellar hook-associated protein FlgL [Stutzerimonas azotifigens]|uniref:flagellar hook-associated protein FlgL n=1 Tax=Stutzerimonas azotifigens TaxID=291995 RepID=UPI000420C1BF|nr:flagellar hook-associated protein FlgL [Stutzerimonas azotifigens]
MRVSTSQIYNGGLSSQQRIYSNVNKAYEQISSGKRIQTAADDPVGAARLLQLEQQSARLEQYAKNLGSAEDTLKQEDATLGTIGNVLQRARELALGVNNGSYGDADRKAVADELEQIEAQLLGLMNSQDVNGQYIFAGANSGTQPFVKNADGSYSYQGDQNQLKLQVTDGMTLATNDSGFNTFYNIANASATQTSLSSTTLAMATTTLPEGQAQRLTAARPVVTGPDQYADFQAGQPYRIEIGVEGAYSVFDASGNLVSDADDDLVGTLDLDDAGSTSIQVNGVSLKLDLSYAEGDDTDTIGAALAGQSFTFGAEEQALTLSQGRVVDSYAYANEFAGSSYQLQIIDGSSFAIYPRNADGGLSNTAAYSGHYDPSVDGGTRFTFRGVEFTLDGLTRDLPAGTDLDEALAGYTFDIGAQSSGPNVIAKAGNPSGASVSMSATGSLSAIPAAGFEVVFSDDDGTLQYSLVSGGRTIITGQYGADNAEISAYGLTLTFSDTPQAGDQFSVGARSQGTQSILDTVSTLRQALLVPTDGNEAAGIEQRNQIANAIANLDNGANQVSSVRSSVGARLNAIESLTTENESLQINNESIQSAIRDMDPVEAITQLNLQQTILEAAQMAFVKISQLSLFDRM